MLLPRALRIASVTLFIFALCTRAFSFTTDSYPGEHITYRDWYKWLTNNNNSNYYNQYKRTDELDGDLNDAETRYETGSDELYKDEILPGYKDRDDSDTTYNFGSDPRNTADMAQLQGLAENKYLENTEYKVRMPFSSTSDRAPQWVGKRSALRAALQAGPGGRRRRDPQPYAPTPPQPRNTFLGSYPIDHAGSLNNIEQYFGALHGSLHDLSSFPPGHRPGPPQFLPLPATFYEDTTYNDNHRMFPPLASARTAPRHSSPAAFLHSLRPDQLRSFDRRSDAGSERLVGYQGTNYHDPALLWAGLGR